MILMDSNHVSKQKVRQKMEATEVNVMTMPTAQRRGVSKRANGEAPAI